MKKTTFWHLCLCACLFLPFVGQSQNVQIMYCDSFENYTTGDIHSQTNNWNSWGGTNNTQDAQVSTAEAYSGTQSLWIHTSGSNLASDVVRPLGPQTSGVWTTSFQVYVPFGYGGYFNFIHDYPEATPASSIWAFETYLNGSTGDCYTTWGSSQQAVNMFDFTINVNDWNHINVVVDLDNDQALMEVNGSIMHSWVWSDNMGVAYEQLDVFNAYSAAPVGYVSSAYYDDFCTDTTSWNCPQTSDANFTYSVVGGAGLAINFNGTNSVGFNHSWDFGDGNTGTGDDITHIYQNYGPQTVILTVVDVCGFSSSDTIVINLVGVDDYFADRFEIFPNPNNGSFKIEAEMLPSSYLKLEIRNQLGELVWETSENEFDGLLQKEIQLELAQGMYMLKTHHDKGVLSKRIIIQ